MALLSYAVLEYFGMMADFVMMQDLRLLATGAAHVSVEEVIKLIHFPGGHQELKQHLEAVLKAFDEDELRKFLLFVCEIDHIPEGGLQNPNTQLHDPGKIRVIVVPDAAGAAHKRPVAHTCFYELELPDYGSGDVLRQMLKDAFEYMEAGSGFQIA